MSNATIPESHRDLLDTPIPVTLATIGPSGHPQVTAIWAILRGDTVVTSLAAVRQKLKNLQARPQATVFVIDPKTWTLLYHGPIDDRLNYESQRPVHHPYLTDALDAVLANKPVAVATVVSPGCLINFPHRKRSY